MHWMKVLEILLSLLSGFILGSMYGAMIANSLLGDARAMIDRLEKINADFKAGVEKIVGKL